MTVKSRGWVKNAAIIFFAALSVLTFFSNTILNYSLPEVAGSYAYYGTIASAIRGQGTVTANQSYSVQISETRRVQSVLIKPGERVEAGQVLFTLEETESAELQEAIKQLESMQLALTRKLLQMQPADYGQENRAIELMQQEIVELEPLLPLYGIYKAAVDEAKEVVSQAKAVVDLLNAELEAIEEKVALISSTDEFDYNPLLTDEIIELREKMKAAQEAEDAAQKALDKANEDLAAGSGNNGSALAALVAQISAKESQITQLKTTRASQKLSVLALIESKYGDGTVNPPAGGPAETAYLAYLAAKGLPGFESAAEALLDASIHSDMEIAAALSSYYNLAIQIDNADMELHTLNMQFQSLQSASDANVKLKAAVDTAKTKLETAKKDNIDAQEAYSFAFKTLSHSFRLELREKQGEVKQAQAVLDEANAALAEAEKNPPAKPEEIENSIKAKQLEIENALFALARQQKSDEMEQALEDLDLQTDRKAIAEQETQIKKLREKTLPSDVTARYGGLITAVNVIPGDNAEPGRDLASLDIEGKGFSISFSVTNQQAQRVRIGEVSTITRYWGDPIQVTLTAINNDPQSQGRSKILEFAVEGSVSVGETLEVTIGERDQGYECVLPNSAIREDANGTFILVAETKSTPLGNRYTAARIDVIVIAKDEINTAISRDGYDYEFVITTATKPVEPGTQVRLAGQ